MILRNFHSVLRRFKMATGLNILGLSVAFAAFMVIMMQLDYDWNYDRFHKNSDRIYRVEATSEKGNYGVLSRPMAELFARSSPHIIAGSICAPWGKWVFSVEKDGYKNIFEEELVKVRPEYMDVFAFTMIEGSDKALEDPAQAIIPQHLATKIFGNEPAIGRSIMLDTTYYTIGGIYKDFAPNTVVSNAIYVPVPPLEDKDMWGNFRYCLYIRVDSPEESPLLVDNFRKAYGKEMLGDNYENVVNAGLRLTLLTDVHFTTDVMFDLNTKKSNRQSLAILFSIAIILTLIAAINFTNFSTALAPVRIRSINTRKILGGEERTLRLSLIAEAMTIAFIAYLVALLWVYLAGHTFIIQLVDADTSLLLHPLIIGGTAILALLVGLFAGLYPAWYMTSIPPSLTLKGNFGLSPKGKGMRHLLIGIQYVASFTLVIGSLFMYLQNKHMQSSSMGYDKEGIIIADINATINGSRDAFANKLSSMAEIEGVTFAQFLLSSQDQYWGVTRSYKDKSIYYECIMASPSFIDLMGINLLEGRDFRESDLSTASGALIFNEQAQKEYGLALGEKVDGTEIVGFMSDIKFGSFRTKVVPMALWVKDGREGEQKFAYIKVKKGIDPRKALIPVSEVLDSFDNGYPFHVRVFDDVYQKTYEKERNLSSLVILFSLITILISLVGVFGLVVFDSEYRRKEIGIRKVLGSTTKEIIVLFNKTYIRILVCCFILSLPIAWYAITKWLENFAYKTPIYWWVFAIAFAIVTAITALTVTLQNWRTANMNPVESIRNSD